MDQAQIEIDASATTVYELVANIENMGSWSPETYRTQWLDGATSAAPGVRFKGWNRTKVWGVPARWATVSTIRQADPGRAFSFDTALSGARWTYRFEPTGDGGSCIVTETRETPSEHPLVRILSLPLAGVRGHQLLAGMQVTLERLKAAAETA